MRCVSRARADARVSYICEGRAANHRHGCRRRSGERVDRNVASAFTWTVDQNVVSAFTRIVDQTWCPPSGGPQRGGFSARLYGMKASDFATFAFATARVRPSGRILAFAGQAGSRIAPGQRPSRLRPAWMLHP